jgi:DNA-binding XRE family transcriptional regulator
MHLEPQSSVLSALGYGAQIHTIAPSALSPFASVLLPCYNLRDTITVGELARFTLEKVAETTTRAASLSFGDKLRALRLRREQSQIALANQLGLSSGAYISNLEAGRKLPSLTLVVRIADLFGVTTDTLLRDEVPIPVENTT